MWSAGGMKRHLLAALLAGAIPIFSHAQASVPAIGWHISPGQSLTGSKICTLFGNLSQHSDLLWVADAASPPQRLTLVFDDGGAPPLGRRRSPFQARSNSANSERS
jgi:hypothetical protein